MFLGRYEHNLDTKGRLMIPAKYRSLLEDGAYITKGFDKNLLMLPSETFEKMSKHIYEMSITNPDARILKRLLFGHAEILSMDKMGRVLIPAFLRSAANLDTTVEIIGAGSYCEIWAAENWAPEELEFDNSLADTQRFSVFDLPI